MSSADRFYEDNVIEDIILEEIEKHKKTRAMNHIIRIAGAILIGSKLLLGGSDPKAKSIFSFGSVGLSARCFMS